VSHSTSYSGRDDLRRPGNMSDALRQALRVLLAAEQAGREGCWTGRGTEPDSYLISGTVGKALHRRGYAERYSDRDGTYCRLTDDGRDAARRMTHPEQETSRG